MLKRCSICHPQTKSVKAFHRCNWRYTTYKILYVEVRRMTREIFLFHVTNTRLGSASRWKGKWFVRLIWYCKMARANDDSYLTRRRWHVTRVYIFTGTYFTRMFMKFSVYLCHLHLRVGVYPFFFLCWVNMKVIIVSYGCIFDGTILRTYLIFVAIEDFHSSVYEDQQAYQFLSL